MYTFWSITQSKKAITVRYLHIFMNELHYKFNNSHSREEEELLTKAFLIIVILHELTHYLFNINDRPRVGQLLIKTQIGKKEDN